MEDGVLERRTKDSALSDARTMEEAIVIYKEMKESLTSPEGVGSTLFRAGLFMEAPVDSGTLEAGITYSVVS